MAHAFISYSHKDKGYAHKLADEMKRRGIDVWIDDRIDYGEQWPRVIQENLEHCQVVIVIMTTDAYNSRWVQNELVFAQGLGKIILPLLVEGKTWLSLASSQYVDLLGGNLPPETFYSTLTRHLKKETVKAELKVQSHRQSIPGDELLLRELIVGHLRMAIKNDQEGRWEMGIFTVSYWHVSAARESYILGSEVTNEDLLRRFDRPIYNDYKANHDALLQNKSELEKSQLPRKGQLVRQTRPSLRQLVDAYTLPLINLRRRLNLDLGRTFMHVPADTEIRQFAEQLLQIHRIHHIPITEIKVKVLS